MARESIVHFPIFVNKKKQDLEYQLAHEFKTVSVDVSENDELTLPVPIPGKWEKLS